MCFSIKSSLIAFLISIISSILLIYYGNYKYKNENKIVGFFLILVAFMQLFDFLFWIDLKNKKGLNYIGTIFAPLFNHLQPTFLYLMILLVYKKYDFFGIFLNILYFLYVFYEYLIFINLNINDKLTIVKDNHLYWKWKINFNYIYYFLIILYNIIFYIQFNYAIIFIFLGAITLLISFKFFKNNIGEIWCYLAAFVPLFILGLTYLI